MSDAPQGWNWQGSADPDRESEQQPGIQYGAPQYETSPNPAPQNPGPQNQAPQNQAPQYEPPSYATQPYGAPQYGPQYGYSAGPNQDTPLAWHAVTPPNGGPGQPAWGPPQPPRPKRSRRSVVAIAAAALVAATALGSTTYAIGASQSGSNQPSASSYRFGLPNTGSSDSTGSGSTGSGSTGSGSTGSGSTGSGSTGSGSTGTQQLPNSGNGGFAGGSSGSSSQSNTDQATAQQSVGVVDINTTLDFGSGAAAGTGIILSSDGTILTNNHVIEGSTSIKVTVVSTGKTYTAKVVGTSPTQDIAVLKLDNASGLQTAALGDSSSVKVGDSVTGVGNAGGDGGTPSAAAGNVTALNQSITATDENGSNAENLTGLIEVDANIQAGDSGGPLYNASNKVVGIDTAASSGRSSTTAGYAIPINTALSIAQQILNGTDNATIHQGYPAFLGVQLQDTSSSQFGGGLGGFSGSGSSSATGATISGVVNNSAADQAGLGEGDTITALNGTAVTSADSLSTAIAAFNPGDKVTVTYTDANGQSHTATVTLGTGPAD
jgi:S1-C subfamily serine protease